MLCSSLVLAVIFNHLINLVHVVELMLEAELGELLGAGFLLVLGDHGCLHLGILGLISLLREPIFVTLGLVAVVQLA